METEVPMPNLPTDVIELLKSIKPNPNYKSLKPKSLNANLYDHIKQMYLTQLTLNDDCKYDDLFEDISIRIKKDGTYFPNNDITDEQIDKILNDPQLIENLLNSFVKEKELLKPPSKAEEGGEVQPITQINFIPDYYELFQKFSMVGISMSKKELILLNNSLTKLATIYTNGNISFFGKFFGTEKDYYVVEATEIDPPENFNYDNDMEKRKEDGVNKNVYLVTNNLCDKWVELPDIKPSQLNESRKIKYFLTGNLDNKIYSNPTFNGTEKIYLRCMIARIYHGTKLVPSINHYTVEEGDQFKPLVPAEKPKPFTYEDILNLKYWIHYPPIILKKGRVSHQDLPEGEGEEGGENLRKKILENDPYGKRIKSIIEDDKIYINPNKSIIPWKIEKGYDDNIYINPYITVKSEKDPDYDPNEVKDNKANYLVTCVRSLRWPGAVNFYNNKECYFFYFGNGHKYKEIEEDNYVFRDFPIIPNDIPDKVDQPEPKEIKEDVVEEKKEEEKKEEEKKDEENKEEEQK